MQCYFYPISTRLLLKSYVMHVCLMCAGEISLHNQQHDCVQWKPMYNVGVLQPIQKCNRVPNMYMCTQTIVSQARSRFWSSTVSYVKLFVILNDTVRIWIIRINRCPRFIAWLLSCLARLLGLIVCECSAVYAEYILHSTYYVTHKREVRAPQPPCILAQVHCACVYCVHVHVHVHVVVP